MRKLLLSLQVLVLFLVGCAKTEVSTVSGTEISEANEKERYGIPIEKFTPKVNREIEKAIRQNSLDFLKQVENDIVQAHKLDLSQYNHALFEDMNIELSKVVMDILSRQSNGDIEPIVYVHQNGQEAYILEKKKSGLNNIYEMAKENGEWKTIHWEQKKGQPMSGSPVGEEKIKEIVQKLS